MGTRDDDELLASGEVRDPSDGTVAVEPRKKAPRLYDAMKKGFAMSVAPRPVNPMMSGFTEIDAGMRRYGAKEFTMLAADSGIGKSTLATQWALHAASCGHGVIYLNLEMAFEMYGLRAGANFARLPIGKAAAGELNPNDIATLAEKFTILKEPVKRIAVGNRKDHRTTKAIADFCAETKVELESEGAPLKLIVVDHILQVMVNVRSGDKDAEGKARSDLLKSLASDLDVHVLALVHITRDGSKHGKMPTKNDMASSAWFDRDADNIFIFHQKRNPDQTFASNKATLSAQKCRWGSPFAVELEYDRGQFYPWALGEMPIGKAAP